MRLNKLLGLFILCTGLTLTSCSIEDGKDGIDGIDGLDGKDGANGQDGAPGQDGAAGQDGANGEDGVGLDEMAQYGAVTLNLSGTRPDGIPFEDSTVFKFTPIDATDFGNYNILTATPMGDDIEYFFNFRRFYSSPDGTYNTTFVDWEVTVINPGQATQNIESVVININKYGVIGADNKYFVIQDTYETGGEGVSEIVIPDMGFDPNSGNHLSFSYTLIVDGANNSSQNELNVSGTVDVHLLEEIQ